MKKVKLLGVGLIIAIWAIAAWLELKPNILLPGPWQVLKALAISFQNGTLPIALGITTARCLAAFVIASLIGTSIGLLVGTTSWLRTILDYPIEFARAMPAAALVPLFMLMLDYDKAATSIILPAFATAVLILFHTAEGCRNIRPAQRNMARQFGASKLEILAKVTLPESLPNIVTGHRLGLSLVLVLVVALELIVRTPNGLGYLLLFSGDRIDMPTTYATLLVVGALGLTLNLIVHSITSRLTHWIGK